MSKWRSLFSRAADGIGSPRLGQAAPQTIHRRHTRPRSAAAAALASTLVVGGCVSTQEGGDRTGLAAPTGTLSQTPSAPVKGSPPEMTGKVWPRWDPRDVDELPAASDRTVPALPAVIKPPPLSPLLVDDPIGIAVVAVERGGVAQLLSPNGAWRTVPIEGRYPHLQLSTDGSRLAVYYYGDDEFDVTVHDLATGEARVLPPPPAYRPWDSSAWVFLNEDELLLGGGSTAYVVTVDTGKAERVPYRAGLSQAVDPAGNVLVSAEWTERNVLTDYRSETPREVSMNLTGRLSSIRAGGATVVGTSYDKRPFALVVADRKTLRPQVSLPLLDHEGNYSNWGLGTLALVDDGRVLLRVAVIGQGKTGFRVVAWDPANGDLSIVSSTDLRVAAEVVFAEGLLRGTAPTAAISG